MSKTRTHSFRAAAAHAAAAAALALAAAACPAAGTAAAAAKPAAQAQSFATPEAGVEALIAALRQADNAALQRVLGPGSPRLIESGDSDADREARAKFVAEYDAKHRIELQGDAKAWLSIGTDDWPMPIPLVRRGAGWAFDTAAGDKEIIARRIGHNELSAIQVCRAFIDMERDYAELDRNGDGVLEYTARLVSTEGRHDGLYWPTAPGEPPSPGGPRLAQADPAQLAAHSAAKPYHGYYFRVLTRQGPHAPGGARDYRADGKLIGGVALIAWPASWFSTGIKTFQCSMDGKVYERNLGKDTAAAAAKITAFDPGPGWAKVQ